MPDIPTQINRRWVVAASLIVAAVAVSGCSRQQGRNLSEQAGDAYQHAGNSLDRTWDHVKSYSYDQRDTVVRDLHSASARTDVQIDTLQANYAQGRANASGRAALQDLRAADSDYHSKLDALSHASADGWNAAKEQAIASWHRLEAALDRARTQAH